MELACLARSAELEGNLSSEETTSCGGGGGGGGLTGGSGSKPDLHDCRPACHHLQPRLVPGLWCRWSGVLVCLAVSKGRAYASASAVAPAVCTVSHACAPRTCTLTDARGSLWLGLLQRALKPTLFLHFQEKRKHECEPWDRCWCLLEMAVRDLAVKKRGKAPSTIIMPDWSAPSTHNH